PSSSWSSAVPQSGPAQLIFFFFPAGDGIRGLYVTGVQSCALPIYGRGRPVHEARRRGQGFGHLAALPEGCSERRLQRSVQYFVRSEERRVGKGGRSLCAG